MAKSLHKKVLIIFGITIVCVILALYGVSQILLLNSFHELEKQCIHQDIERVTNVLSNEFSAMDAIAYDWAAGDDTYAFIEDANEQTICRVKSPR